ncbi:serine hydrolase [Limosilactobacillus sp.]|uniref:serine hydrolase n=1 Tax=Limosilactobacillus sp. TaxID=2773925 RepID=UPI0025B84CCB|nr:serine hydrolase [Limosilactobacillus sp.]MCH3921519.1 class A beta-lactamase-related serine hydrolase [Limosilactobacillus sp.]MCH3928290.1 class A beta-lactamase-related serine hydrolase [Limosilactobacillus sp.]
MTRTLKSQLITNWGKIMNEYGNASSIAVFLQKERREFSFTNEPKLRYETASTVKVAVLSLLLHTNKGQLDQTQQRLAEKMIRNSNNKATTAILENYLGGILALKAIYRDLRMTNTTASDWWGTTLTVPHDQLKLLRMIYGPTKSDYLDDRSRKYIQSLMANTNPQQQWGISAGSPRFFLKDGWRKASDNKKWEVHSIGCIPDARQSYLIAIYTRNNRNFNSGVSYVEKLARTTRQILDQ